MSPSEWLQANLSDVIVAAAQAGPPWPARRPEPMRRRRVLTFKQVRKMSSTGANTSGLGSNAREPLHPYDMPNGAGEFSWGSGLEPPSVRGKPPSEGGMYRGITPDCAARIGVGRC